MRPWFINGRFLTQPLSGVQRYAREVVAALDQELLFQNAGVYSKQVELLLPSNANLDITLKAIRPRHIGCLTEHAWEQFELAHHAKGVLLSLCNTGPVLHRKQIVTIHDVNTREFPQSYTRTFRWAYRILHPALGKTAQAIATVSKFSAKQIADYGIAESEKIAIASNGCDHTKLWRQHTPTSLRTNTERNTILVLGTNAPHKNLSLLTGMADQLATNGLRLSVIGMTADHVFSAYIPNASHPSIDWCGRLTDTELADRFAKALCLAFPSWTEGFGLPPLESMSLGCPVVASDRSSIPEVCGQAALYAAPDNPDAWLTAFLSLKHDQTLRQNLISAGHSQAAIYTWQATAKTYLNLIAALQLNQNPRLTTPRTRTTTFT